MAQKEATIYIVDVGKNMGDEHSGRDQSDLDWSLQWVWDKITTTVEIGRKTAMLSVIGLRTDDTENELAHDDVTMGNISVFQPIQQTLMPDIRRLRERLVPSRTNEGDAISTLILALHMISEHCKKLKYIKKIYLVTNGRGRIDTDDEGAIEGIIKKLKDDNVELTVLGVDFDDADYGFKEEGKSETKAANEDILRSITEGSGGQFGTLDEAISSLGTPRVKITRPYKSFVGTLNLGDPENYDTAVTIDIERYSRIMLAKPPSASSYVVRSSTAADEASAQSSMTLQNGDEGPSHAPGDLAAIKNARSYQVIDDDAPGGKKDVPQDELEKGYEYGRTAVHISDGERNIVDLPAEPSLDIIGFVPKENVPRYFEMSRSSVIVAQKANDKASLALSSFIHALHELDTYAIARFVNKPIGTSKAKPVIALLAPEIDFSDGENPQPFECLVEVELPFAEDVRQYKFPPLDRVLLVSGKTITEHRNLPNDALMQAMSDYVDSMDISNFGKDDDGNDCEYASMDQTYSPALHNINRNIQHRAARGNDSLAPVRDILVRYSKPPEELVDEAKKRIDAVIRAADVKKVPPKQRGKRSRPREVPLSGLDIDALLKTNKRTKVDPDNAIPSYKQMFTSEGDDPKVFKEASEQLFGLLCGDIQNSVGDSGYGRAIEKLRVMREEMVEYEEPDIYNSLVSKLKEKIFAGSLGGERREMWILIRGSKLGLVDKKASERSTVTEEEAKEFLQVRAPKS